MNENSNAKWPVMVAAAAGAISVLISVIALSAQSFAGSTGAAICWWLTAIWFYVMHVFDWRMAEAAQRPKPTEIEEEVNGKCVLTREAFFAGLCAAIGLAVIALGHSNLPSLYILVMVLSACGFIFASRADYAPGTITGFIIAALAVCALEFSGLWGVLSDAAATGFQIVDHKSHVALRQADKYSESQFVLKEETEFLAYTPNGNENPIIDPNPDKHYLAKKGQVVYVSDEAKKYKIGGIYYTVITTKNAYHNGAGTDAYLVKISAIDWDKKTDFNRQPRLLSGKKVKLRHFPE
jgi:hypothetical protein